MTTPARGLLALEPVILLLVTFFFWYPIPAQDPAFSRDKWLWLLALLLPVYGARWFVHRRLWTRTPLDGWLIAFLALGVANIYVANLDPANPPYTRGLLMLARPLQGMALYLYCAEYVRTRGHNNGLLAATALGGLALGVLSLYSTDFTGKSDQLDFITRVLPTRDFLPSAGTRFNPNEIAGALAWVTPLLAALAIHHWQARAGGEAPLVRLIRWGETLAFVLVFAGLFLGQSRFALFGVLAALLIVASVLIPAGRARTAARAPVLLVTLIEAVLVLNLLPPAASSQVGSGAGLSSRDESSLSKRLGIWGSGLAIIRDFPLTGAGMAMFRDGRIRERYPAPMPNAPHAHNEWIQIGADLGLPGLIVFVAWQVGLAYMLTRAWQRGDHVTRAMALGVGAGLFAHAVFGLGDAIPLWDRLSFVFWWLAGLAGAAFVRSAENAAPDDGLPRQARDA